MLYGFFYIPLLYLGKVSLGCKIHIMCFCSFRSESTFSPIHSVLFFMCQRYVVLLLYLSVAEDLISPRIP